MRLRLFSLIALLTAACWARGAAALPQFVTYSGRLADGTGWGQSLPGVTLTFALYDAETGGTRLWEQTFADVVLVDGAFSVVLGEGTGASGGALPVTDVFAEREAVWVAIAVAPPDGDGTDLAPRQPVGSVPYAARAERAERVEARYGTTRYSINAFYRGSTAGVAAIANHGSFNADGETQGEIAFPDQDTQGYVAAKLACEVALASPSAHMCTSEEMARSAQMGFPVDAGGALWVTAGMREEDSVSDAEWQMTADCSGWTAKEDNCVTSSPGASCFGPTWYNRKPSYSHCYTANRVACCD